MQSISQLTLKTIRQFGLKSIYFKYFFRIFIIILLPFVLLSLFIYIAFTRNLNQNTLSDLRQSFEKTCIFFDNVAEESYGKYLYFTTSGNVISFLNTDEITAHNSALFGFKNICLLLGNPTYAQSYIVSQNIYGHKSGYILSGKSSGYRAATPNTEWIDSVNAGHPIGLSPGKSGGFHISYYLSYQKNLTGVYSLHIDDQRFLKLANHFSIPTEFALYDTYHHCFILKSSDLFDDFAPLLEKDPENSFPLNTEYGYIQAASLGFPDIVLLASSDYETFQEHFPFGILILICATVSLLLSFLLAFYISTQYYSSISNIIIQLQGNFMDPYGSAAAKNELMYISNRIMATTENALDLENKLAENLSALSLYQTLMLQCQLNPHFIFNVLNSTNLLIMKECKDERPVELISLLCELLVSVLDTRNYIVPLSEEIQYAQTYIKIEKIKRNDNFDVEYALDETLFRYTTIKFILQPIIENALKHGNEKNPPYRGKISISVCRQADDIILSVSNNYPGMTPAELETLRQKLRQKDILFSEHIGLINIHKRLEIYYGEGYGITDIKSDPDNTQVVIRIPMVPPHR